MDSQSFKDMYMSKIMGNIGPEVAAILKVGKPGIYPNRGFVYDAERKDYERILPDEVVVPIGTYGSGEETFRTGKPRRAGSSGMPWYSGGVPASDLQNYTGTPEYWRQQYVPEDIIEGLKPGHVPAYIDETDKYGAEFINNCNAAGDRPAVILRGAY